MDQHEQRLKDEAQFIRRKQLFESLIEHPGWKEMVAIAEAWRGNHITQLIRLTPEGRDGISATQEDNYRKGIVFAIDMFLGTPNATIANANELIRQRQENTSNARHDLDPGQHSRQPDLFDDTTGERLGPNTVVTDLG